MPDLIGEANCPSGRADLDDVEPVVEQELYPPDEE